MTIKIPTTQAQYEKMGDPKLDWSFFNLNHTTRDMLLHFYWYSVAKPDIKKQGYFDKKRFDELYLSCLKKYSCGFDDPSLDEKYMALKEARDLFEAEKAPKKEEQGFTGLLRDCFHPDSIWG